MGLLGLHSELGFSKRLFNSFDIDIDGKVLSSSMQISFQDFVEYMEILKTRDSKHKARISYRLIDVRNLNKVNKQDFM